MKKETLTAFAVNLQQGFLVNDHNQILLGYSHHLKRLFVPENPGFGWSKYYEVPESFKGYQMVGMVGGFNITAYDFASGKHKELHELK